MDRENANGNVHVFVDFSNFWYYLCQTYKRIVGKKISEEKFKPLIKALRIILFQGEKYQPETRLIVGSIPSGCDMIWDYLRDQGFQVNLFNRIIVKGNDQGADRLLTKEIGVDNTLHAQMLSVVCDIKMNPKNDDTHTMVLFTGDGNNNHDAGGFKDGFINSTTFPRCVRLALDNGWNVRLYSWKDTCSDKFDEFRSHEGFKHFYLDDFPSMMEIFEPLEPYTRYTVINLIYLYVNKFYCIYCCTQLFTSH